MFVKINSKGQVTLPARVLDKLGVKLGDHLEIREGPDGFTLHPRRIDRSLLGLLRDKIPPDAEPLDIQKFRRERETTPSKGLGTDIHQRFKRLGGVDLEMPPRDPMHDPPQFGR